ncbi:MAG: hypothetical protein DHS20C05_12240 [Hyphococcus sp.]|nr:MAG: hypothetical protein DHS20C05_12240 [Marinicaulis sp.]
MKFYAILLDEFGIWRRAECALDALRKLTKTLKKLPFIQPTKCMKSQETHPKASFA